MKQKKSSKNNSSNLFNRYVWLVDLIYRRERITFEEVNECWQRSLLNPGGEDIPLRTFHNHRIAIEEMFGINIECDKRNDYKYYIENADDMEQGGTRSWLLNTFIVNNLINESHKIKQRILFEKIPSGQKYVTPIIEAMRDNLSVEITYQSFGRSSPNTFEVHPYCIKVFKQRWYVVAYNPYLDEIRIYAFDRINGLLITANPFQLPADFDGEEFFANSFGIIVDKEVDVEKAVIKTYKPQDNYIRALPLHHSQKEEENAPDYTIFSYYIRPTFDFRQEILSHGDELEVLQPQWFRNAIAGVAEKQRIVYQEI